MGELRNLLSVYFLLVPVVIMAIMTSCGYYVVGRDDYNYFYELESSAPYVLRPDFLSWSFMHFFYGFFDNIHVALRWLSVLLVTMIFFSLALEYFFPWVSIFKLLH